jgi:cytochrome c
MRISALSMLIGGVMMPLMLPAAAQYGRFEIVDGQRAAGRQLFAEHCMACHGRAGVAAHYAPSLIGVFGRPAGSAPGFPYSEALKHSGIVWSDEKLMKWISDAPATVPGTPMPHVSIADPAERLFIIEYLKTLSQPAKKPAR